MRGDGHAATGAAESLCPVAEIDLPRTRSIGCQDRKPISNMEWALMIVGGMLRENRSTCRRTRCWRSCRHGPTSEGPLLNANRSGIPSARREEAVSQWAMRSGTEA
jgi:hypothetical protein